MLTSTLIHLRTLAHGELPLNGATGCFGHAAFLPLIESVEPALAQVLHDLDDEHERAYNCGD